MKLSKRQVQILNLIKEGKSNFEIGNTLTISEGTVKQHLFQLYKKLNVKNRTQALIKYQNSLTSSDSVTKNTKTKVLNNKFTWRLISSLSLVPELEKIDKNTSSIIKINNQINQLKSEAETICSIFDGNLITIPGVGIVMLFGFPQDHSDDCHRSVIAAQYLTRWSKNNITIPIKFGIVTLPEVYLEDKNIVFKTESIENSIKLAKLSKLYQISVNEITYQFTKSLFYYSEQKITNDKDRTIYRDLTNDVTKYKNHNYYNYVSILFEKIKTTQYLQIKIFCLDHTEIVLIQDLIQNISNNENLIALRISLPHFKNEELFYKSLLGQILLNNKIIENSSVISIIKKAGLSEKEKVIFLLKAINKTNKLILNLVGFNSEYEANKILENIDIKDDKSLGFCLIMSEININIKGKIKIKYFEFQNNEWDNTKSYSFKINQYNKNIQHYHSELSRIISSLTAKSLEILYRLAHKRIVYLSNISDSIDELKNTNLVDTDENRIILKNKKVAEILKEIIFNPESN